MVCTGTEQAGLQRVSKKGSVVVVLKVTDSHRSSIFNKDCSEKPFQITASVHLASHAVVFRGVVWGGGKYDSPKNNCVGGYCPSISFFLWQHLLLVNLKSWELKGRLKIYVTSLICIWV